MSKSNIYQPIGKEEFRQVHIIILENGAGGLYYSRVFFSKGLKQYLMSSKDLRVPYAR